MNFDQLTTFRAVATAGTFQRASQLLHITQPAVSKQIRALEGSLGVRLLDRGRQVRLTFPGEVLLKYADDVCRIIDAAQHEIDELRGEPRGRLSVSVSPSLALPLMPDLLRRYRERYPQVDVTLESTWPADVVTHVIKRDVDIGIVVIVQKETELCPQLKAIPIGESEAAFVVSPSHPLAKRKGVTFADLKDVPWILSHNGCNFRSYLCDRYHERGWTLNVAMVVPGLELQAKLAEIGLGISALPKECIVSNLREGRLRSLKPKGIEIRATTCLVYRHDKYVHDAMKAFIKLVTSSGRALN